MRHIPIILKAGSNFRLSNTVTADHVDRYRVLVDFDLMEQAEKAGVDMINPSDSVKHVYAKQMKLAEYLITNGFVELSHGGTAKKH